MFPNWCSTNVFGSTSHEQRALDMSRSLSPSHTNVICGGDACHAVDKTVSIPDRLLFAEAAGMSQATAGASQPDRLIAWLCFGFRFQEVNLAPLFSDRKQQHDCPSSRAFHHFKTKLSIQLNQISFNYVNSNCEALHFFCLFQTSLQMYPLNGSQHF